MKPEDVDSYIADTPMEVREKLEVLRNTIKNAVPEATERISYGMPYYDYKGRLAYFRLAKRHIGLYIPSPVIDEYQQDLNGYFAEKATIHLPLEKDLPVELISKLVKARATMNDKAAGERAT